MKIYNDNPQGKRVDDCTVRAIAVATGESMGRYPRAYGSNSSPCA